MFCTRATCGKLGANLLKVVQKRLDGNTARLQTHTNTNTRWGLLLVYSPRSERQAYEPSIQPTWYNGVAAAERCRVLRYGLSTYIMHSYCGTDCNTLEARSACLRASSAVASAVCRECVMEHQFPNSSISLRTGRFYLENWNNNLAVRSSPALSNELFHEGWHCNVAFQIAPWCRPKQLCQRPSSG